MFWPWQRIFSISFIIITLFAWLYVLVGILLKWGKHLYDYTNSLRGKACVHRTSLDLPLFVGVYEQIQQTERSCISFLRLWYLILELFRHCGILGLFRQCGIFDEFRHCGYLEYFRPCGILEYLVVRTLWYFRIVLIVWYFRMVKTVWYFWIVQKVWYFRIVPTVRYLRIVPSVWYFRIVRIV